ncbi:MAG: hypothetical protein HY647_11540 [Acidobacteria bacterium]|nr:hypothetical protein [Acidobacteriota bacterium]
MWRCWRRASRLAIAMLACGLASGELWGYCAVCQTALLNSPEGQRMAEGFNSGILFLLAAPFLVAATVAFTVFKVHRRLPGLRVLVSKRPQRNLEFVP